MFLNTGSGNDDIKKMVQDNETAIIDHYDENTYNDSIKYFKEINANKNWRSREDIIIIIPLYKEQKKKKKRLTAYIKLVPEI